MLVLWVRDSLLLKSHLRELFLALGVFRILVFERGVQPSEAEVYDCLTFLAYVSIFSIPNLRAFLGLGVPRVSTISSVSLPFCFPSFYITSAVVMVMDPVALNFSAISMIRNGLDFVVAFCFPDFDFKSFTLLSFLLHLMGCSAPLVTMIRVPKTTSLQTVEVCRRVIIVGEQTAGIIH